MCGIAGIYSLNDNHTIQVNTNVLKSLQHRGPDAQNFIQFDKCILYHTRLSIIDLSQQSMQPYTINNAEKSIVFNGEIFNYKALASKLADISTTGDVEVLIKHFEKYNKSGLHELNGFFAFAYFDKNADELYVVRDRYGEKPLYYYYDKNIFVFASELKALLLIVQQKFNIDTDALYTYFRLNYIAGNKTILKNIYKLLPGHCVEIKKNNINISQWYHLEDTKIQNTSFRNLMIDAVETRLVSDAPVGAFLSGGIDSSIVSALAAQSHQNIHTFSMGFKGEHLYNETKDAEKVANFIKSNHHSFEVSFSEIEEEVQQFFQTIDMPFADSSALNIYILSKKIKPFVTVALSGDGADELFMGYNKHKPYALNKNIALKAFAGVFGSALSVLPQSRSHGFFNKIRKAKKLFDAINLPPLQQYIYLSQWSDDAHVHRLLSRDVNMQYFYNLFDKYKQMDSVTLVNKADLDIVLTDDMLYKTDFFAMQNAVEIRSPFLDYRVVEHALRLEFNQKINGYSQKYILRQTFKDILPAFVFTKKKSGFEVPIHKIISTLIQNNDLAVLDESYIREQGVFNYLYIQKLIVEMLNHNQNDAAIKLWAVIAFQSWYKNFSSFIAHD